MHCLWKEGMLSSWYGEKKKGDGHPCTNLDKLMYTLAFTTDLSAANLPSTECAESLVSNRSVASQAHGQTSSLEHGCKRMEAQRRWVH